MTEQDSVYSLYSEVTNWFGNFKFKDFARVRYLCAGMHAIRHCSGGLYLRV